MAWIEDFLALARTQNFTQAALQRSTTQPAFSRRIHLLEEWLGSPLFDRETRPIQLTSSGKDFMHRAQRMREDILDARRITMSSKSYYDKAARLYATTAVAVGIIPQWLKNTETLHASILTSSTAGCMDALRQKRADRIFLPWFGDEAKDPQLIYEKIAEDNLILIEATRASQNLRAKGNVLQGSLLMHAPGTVFGQRIATHMEQLSITHEGDILSESSSVEVLLALVKRGEGAAWIPHSLLDPAVKRCDVPKKWDVPCTIMMIVRAS
ncbi:MAG: LysR family transcriptional regulator [Alphaproteobacteria bacterium]